MKKNSLEESLHELIDEISNSPLDFTDVDDLVETKKIMEKRIDEMEKIIDKMVKIKSKVKNLVIALEERISILNLTKIKI